MNSTSQIWKGTGYGIGKRVLVFSLGSLNRYYAHHPVSLGTPSISDIIQMKLEGKDGFATFDPLNIFEWSLRGGRTLIEDSYNIWNSIVLVDSGINSVSKALDNYQPTHVLMWDRQATRNLLDKSAFLWSHSQWSETAPQGSGRLSNGELFHILGMGNPTKFFPWMEWHKIINNFLTISL